MGENGGLASQWVRMEGWLRDRQFYTGMAGTLYGCEWRAFYRLTQGQTLTCWDNGKGLICVTPFLEIMAGSLCVAPLPGLLFL